MENLCKTFACLVKGAHHLLSVRVNICQLPLSSLATNGRQRCESALGNQLGSLSVLCQAHMLTNLILCRQWSGVNGVSFFAPQIFAGVNALGSGNEGSLIAAVIVNGVQLIATIITVFIVDRVGRRTLLIGGSMLGFSAEIAVAIVFAVSAGTNAIQLPYGASIAAIVLVGSAAFAWLFILLPSEAPTIWLK